MRREHQVGQRDDTPVQHLAEVGYDAEHVGVVIAARRGVYGGAGAAEAAAEQDVVGLDVAVNDVPRGEVR